jgi:Flp pilus assembly protein TadD
LTEAITEYQEALRLNADNPEAEHNLALALIRVNRRDEAIPHLREALRLKPDNEAARKQLELLTGPPPK